MSIYSYEYREILKLHLPLETDRRFQITQEAKDRMEAIAREFISNVLKHAVDQMISEGRSRLSSTQIDQVIDKTSLVLRIYPKVAQPVSSKG